MRWRNRLLSFLAALAVLTAALSGAAPISAATVAQLKEQRTALENREQENARKLEQLREDAGKQEEYLLSLQEQIDTVTQELDLMVEGISTLDQSISHTDAAIAEKKALVDEDYAWMKENLSGLYLSQSADTLSLLLGNTSFSEYAEAALHPSEEAKRRIPLFSERVGELKDLRAAEAAAKQELRQRREELNEKSFQLSRLYEQSEHLLETVKQSEGQAALEAEQIAEEKQKTNDAIDAWFQAYLAEQAAVNGSSVTNLGGAVLEGKGRFAWPIPGFTELTCYFGEDGHRGIDVAGSGIYGQAIVASDGGTVAYAGWMGSYGYVVFLDHGNGFQTRYAHMSAIACEEGDEISQNQVIGFIGSTGNSTGPHLHFEVLYGEDLTNPLDYF